MRWTDLINANEFNAVLFDLDGVLTPTAEVHAQCWKRMFDEFLQERSRQRGEPFQPFEIGTDYYQYVDGKPRYDGVQSFLQGRSISLPYGKPSDPPGQSSVCGLGNRKDALVSEVLDAKGVKPFPGALAFVQAVRQAGFKTGVVSSSRGCQAVLRAAGMENLFDVRVDGLVAEERRLAGKPAPDMFLEAARALGAAPVGAVVVEDAIAGTQAGQAGGFGLVIGIADGERADTLRAHGADVVVADLGELL